MSDSMSIAETFTFLSQLENLVKVQEEGEMAEWHLKPDDRRNQIEWMPVFFDHYRKYGKKIVEWDETHQFRRISDLRHKVLVKEPRGKLWFYHFLYSTEKWNYACKKDTRSTDGSVKVKQESFQTSTERGHQKDSKYRCSHQSQFKKGQRRFVTPAQR